MGKLKTAEEVQNQILDTYFKTEPDEIGGIMYIDFAGNTYPTARDAILGIPEGIYNKGKKRKEEKDEAIEMTKYG